MKHVLQSALIVGLCIVVTVHAWHVAIIVALWLSTLKQQLIARLLVKQSEKRQELAHKREARE
jgi:membrane protein implicated in regulation of membrane protease activity